MTRSIFLIGLAIFGAFLACGIFHWPGMSQGSGPAKDSQRADAFFKMVQPILKKYCLDCHSTKSKKGDLDLERFTSLAAIRKDLRPWKSLIEQIETQEMPPKEKPQPLASERDQLLKWVRGMLDAETRAMTGDPGPAPLRRLSNAEYDTTIRDLTGVDLLPAREFPADGAGGEGFTNAAESLSDFTPTLFNRYLKSAKDIADHAVLLPDGFRFSLGKTRRDWSDEGTARLRQFYASHVGSEGRLPIQPYLVATVRHREAILKGKVTVEAIAQQEKLNTKYLQILWQTLTGKAPSQPLEGIRSKWRSATEKEAPELAADIASWQTALWKKVRIGNYIQPVGSAFAESLTRQVSSDPPALETVLLKVTVKPKPGQDEVVVQLTAQNLTSSPGSSVVWHRPRFESQGKPALLLRDIEQFKLPKFHFGKHPDGKPLDAASFMTPVGQIIELRLPAMHFVGREFVVEGRLDGNPGERIVQVRAIPGPEVQRGGPLLASAESASYKRLVQGYADFRRVFPLYLCFPQVIPTDETVSLKMFHREDEPLARLFLNAGQLQKLDRLWDEQRFISRQPIAEDGYLPQFIGFVTQDQPKAMLAYFERQRDTFQKRALAFLQDEEKAIPQQMDALLDFAGRAFRRPLRDKEKADLKDLYGAIRKKGADHPEAFRGVLTRVLAAPAFLFRIEKSPPGSKPAPLDDFELATRLSYFLWASLPDPELRQLAEAGKLRAPHVLTQQVQRMLHDERVRALAIEFGTQWLHVRGFDGLKEKNEKLFPTFNANLRKAIYEESILFFEDFFKSDRAMSNLLEADYTFLNDTLAKHYGIPEVKGSHWRLVNGVRKYGRGGILGLASIQAKQSGASRTSPVLRGNWVVETLLGEKLPNPPANVPILPDEEGTDKLTTRQMVEKHVSNASCATCHIRIDPLGFAFENFDAIGRYRLKDSAGVAVDTRAKLRDGTEFEGIEGLRNYLVTKKKDVVERLFCQRLLGYAIGRATTLSDTSLINEMMAELRKNDGRVTAAVFAIVRSPQFRMIRGVDAVADE